MTEKKSMLRVASENFAVTSVGNLALKVLSIGATFFVLRAIDPYTYGLWQLLLSVVGAFGALTLGSMSGVAVADISRALGEGDTARARLILRKVAALFSSLGILAGLILVPLAPVIDQISGINLEDYLWILAAAVAAGGIRQACQVAFQAYLEPIRAQLFQALNSALYLAGILLLVVAGGQGLLGIVISYAIATIAPVLFFAPILLSRITLSRTEIRSGSYSFRHLWDEGRWTLLEDYVSAGIASLWPWLVGYFISIETVGQIGIALTLISQVAAVAPLGYLLRGLLPRVAHDPERLHDWTVRSFRYSFWSNVFVGTGVFIAASILFPILFPKYVAAIPLFGALLISLIPRSLNVILEWFYAVRDQQGFFIVSTTAQILSLLPLIPLLMYLGTNGFVVWYLLNTTAVILACLLRFRARTGISPTVRDLVTFDGQDWDYIRRFLARIASRFASTR